MKYVHWLKVTSYNEEKQWKSLREYCDKYDCDMQIYYIVNSTEKIVRLECNQSYEELDLDVNSLSTNLYRYSQKPQLNLVKYKNKTIDFFASRKYL